MSGVAIVVFSDLVDSTALLARLGDDRMDRVRRAHVEDVGREVAAGGGRVVKTLGDGVMASFGSAIGALRAAAGIQLAVARLDEAEGAIGIAARVGVSAGEPIADGDDLHGMAVVIASRLCSAAGTGEVLVQDVVGALVASRDGVDLEGSASYDLKGVPGPVLASKLSPRAPAADASPSGGGATTLERPSAPFPRLPPQLAAYAEEPLVGRDGQIAALREAVAGTGRRAVLILGEPGIGKTRHAAAVAAESHAQGGVVVLARCPPDPVVPFEPWVRGIGELAIAGDHGWRQSLARSAGSELTALVPELGDHRERVEEAAAEETVLAEGGRYRLLRGIGAALAHAAGEKPLLVVLDDAHWCDPASAQALEHLLDSSVTGLTLVVTARDSELGRRHSVSRVLSNLRRTGDLTELRLDGFDAAGLVELIGARTGRAITPRLAGRLQARTAGNPFFAGELARDLEERGALGSEDALDRAPVPDAVKGLVEERLARLDPATERLLTAVAAIGPSAPVQLAADAAGLVADDASRAVREALSERLISETVAERPTVAFPHALIREALIAEAEPPALARLHLAIAERLEEDPAAEASELARHYGLSVGVGAGGAARALGAYRAAATAAAAGHDHEQAASHLQRALALEGDEDSDARGELLLGLGEQRLLAGDLVRGRGSFQGAIEAARSSGNAVMLTQAALGFAGGDIGFGFESGIDDPACRTQLEEALDALGGDEPSLALRALFRLAYLSVYDRDEDFFAATSARAAGLAGEIGGPGARLLAEFTRLTGVFSRGPGDPLEVLGFYDQIRELRGVAEECEREDLKFRYVQWLAAASYAKGLVDECDEAIEWAARLAARLGSPRFTWEVDHLRAQRLLDRGERAAGEALLVRACAALRRLRPDLQALVQLGFSALVAWLYDDETTTIRLVFEANQAEMSWGLAGAMAAMGAAVDGDLETGRTRMWELLGNDLEGLRGPDGHFPSGLFMLAQVAALCGDRAAAERLLPWLDRLRGYVILPAPAIGFGQLPEWHIGQLQLVIDQPGRAAAEFRETMARADSIGSAYFSSAARVGLALALDRRGEHDDAEAVLEAGERIAARHGLGSVEAEAAAARAKLAAQPLPAAIEAAARRKPLRGFAARGGRLALARMVRGRDDAELERRFADPARQRALLRAMARGFQPGAAAGFAGTIAYELEPYAIERPADAPWRWAIGVDAGRGQARLVEPAPLDAAVTIHFGLADWVRVTAGLQEALPTIIAGRCTIEGDVALAARLEMMFGGD